jgi:hypothetical protein
MGNQATISTCLGLVGWLLISNLGYAQNDTILPQFSEAALHDPVNHKEVFEQNIPILSLPVYSAKEEAGSVLLENGYARYGFQNADDWPPQAATSIRPTAVDIIFTQYPKEKAFWLTDYHWLLSKRLQALFQLDNRFNDQRVQFRILLQTDCENEMEAMQLYHGIRVRYEPLTGTTREREENKEVNDQSAVESNEKEAIAASENEEAVNSALTKKIKRFMVREKHYMDSTVFNALNRHPDWQGVSLVIDWTGSMYGYGAEAILWHAINEERSGIEQVFFFNDGDNKKNRKKVPGYTGGIYQVSAKPASKALKYFQKVKQKGNGGDSPENDIEALITAISKAPDAKEIILIADNMSCIRDFSLLSCINRPVRIILCGTQRGINHQYLNVAYATNGSLHTKSSDFDMVELGGMNVIEINGVNYTPTPDGLLVPSNRFDDRFGFCNRYYRYNANGRKAKKPRREPGCFFVE